MANVYVLDTSKFEMYKPPRGGNSIKKGCQEPYLLFSENIKNGSKNLTNQVTLSLPKWLMNIAKEKFGERCDIFFDPNSRVIALRKGGSVKLSSSAHMSRMKLSISGWYNRLIRSFGNHRRVYFEADFYDNDFITLTPTGEVDDA